MIPLFIYTALAQQRVALLGHLTQSLSFPAAVLTGDHPDVAGDLVGGSKATGIAEKYLRGQGRHRSHARMRQQPARLCSLLGLFFHFFIQLLDPPLQLSVQTE